MRGRLIVFSGIDGGGKSTQIDRLAQLLTRTEHTVVVLWARGGYTSGMNLLKSVLRRGSCNRLVPESGHSDQRTQSFGNSRIRRIWLRLAILDLMRVYGLGMRWHLFRRKTVLCDRYWQDTLLDFQLNFPNENVDQWWLWRLLVRIAPKPDAAFLLLVPADVSRERGRQKQEPFPTPDDVLELRLKAYHSWVDNSHGESHDPTNWHAIDGQRSVDEIATEIVERLVSLFPHFSKPQSMGVV